MATRLKRSVMVGFSDAGLCLVTETDASVTLDLPRRSAADAAKTLARDEFDVGFLEERVEGLLEALTRIDALEPLNEASEIQDSPHHVEERRQVDTHQIVPLIDAVLSPEHIREGMQIICTNAELLVLPAATIGSARKRCLRLFVSGLRPAARLLAYAAAASRRERTVATDQPRKGFESRLMRAQYEGPTVIGLARREVSRSGDIGRLHVVQRAVPSATALARNLVLHRHTVSHAAPNLHFPEVEDERLAWGTSFDPADARRRAISEGVERFAAGDVRAHRVKSGRASRIDRAVDPRRFVAYLPRQIKAHPDLADYDPANEYWWVSAENAKGDVAHVPADLVFYPFAGRGSRRTVLAFATSSGVATHHSREQARRLALLELVERDAVMRTWFAREAPPKIDISSHPRLSQERALVDALARAGWSVSLLDVSSREACVVLGVGVRDGAIVLVASPGRPLNAIRQALVDPCACRRCRGGRASAGTSRVPDRPRGPNG